MSTPLEKWVEKQAELTSPKRIYWCNGSEKEAREIVEIGMREEKINDYPIFTELNQKTWPNAYYHRSHPTDVARTEQLTFVCHSDKETAGPNNNWMHPDEAKSKLTKLSDGCMKGRTMYVLPYMMGHPDSPYKSMRSDNGCQLCRSKYENNDPVGKRCYKKNRQFRKFCKRVAFRR